MKTLESGQNKIQKICDKLRVETLEPAKQEAAQIVEDAKAQAEQILAAAREEAASYLHKAKKQIEQERNVFESSLAQAGKQSIEALKQKIDKAFFDDQIAATLQKQAAEPQLIAKILDALVTAITREGISADLSAIIPRTVSKEELAKHLAEGVYKTLQKHPFVLGDFVGGVQVKLVDKKMTVDMSDKTLKDLLSEYVRKDFRKLLFGDS